MSAATMPIPMHVRPTLGRLVSVELRKMVDTRAGFCLQIATVAVTVIAVILRAVVGGAADHTFSAVLDIAVKPAAFLLPVAGILLVTSEWSQRSGMITFALVPHRSRVIGAKLIASLALTVAMLVVVVAAAAAAVLVGSPGIEGTWSDLAPLIAQSAIYLTAGMVTGVAFGAILLTSAPAIVALYTLPTAWAALGSVSYFADSAPWLDTSRALGPLPQEILDPTQWAHVGTALALWMLLPLAIGIWRITRAEAAS